MLQIIPILEQSNTELFHAQTASQPVSCHHWVFLQPWWIKMLLTLFLTKIQTMFQLAKMTLLTLAVWDAVLDLQEWLVLCNGNRLVTSQRDTAGCWYCVLERPVPLRPSYVAPGRCPRYRIIPHIAVHMPVAAPRGCEQAPALHPIFIFWAPLGHHSVPRSRNFG